MKVFFLSGLSQCTTLEDLLFSGELTQRKLSTPAVHLFFVEYRVWVEHGLWINFNMTAAMLSHIHCDCPPEKPCCFSPHSCPVNQRQIKSFSDVLTTGHWYQECTWLPVKPSTFQLGWNHFHPDLYMCLSPAPAAAQDHTLVSRSPNNLQSVESQLCCISLFSFLQLRVFLLVPGCSRGMVCLTMHPLKGRHLSCFQFLLL